MVKIKSNPNGILKIVCVCEHFTFDHIIGFCYFTFKQSKMYYLGLYINKFMSTHID